MARSIYHEMLTQDVPNVYLDLRSYISEARIREHFPTIYTMCQQYGIDITTDLVPVGFGSTHGGVRHLTVSTELQCHNLSRYADPLSLDAD